MTRKMRVCRLALAQFVAEARPDWDRSEFDGIVVSVLEPLPDDERPAAFASLALRTVRLLGIDDSSAADLRQETRSPVQPAMPAVIGDAGRGAALARRGMARALIEADMAKAGDDR